MLWSIWNAYYIVVLKDTIPVKSKKKKGCAGAGASGGAGSAARATKEKQDERARPGGEKKKGKKR